MDYVIIICFIVFAGNFWISALNYAFSRPVPPKEGSEIINRFGLFVFTNAREGKS